MAEADVEYFAVGVGDKPGVYLTEAAATAAMGKEPIPLCRRYGCRAAADAFVEMFTANPGNTTVVYTDGACVGNGTPGCVGGVGVFWGEGDPRNVSRRVTTPQPHSNNIAELQAIQDAVTAIHAEGGHRHYRIVTDSKYALSAVTEYYDGFVARGWRTTAGTEVKNQPEIRAIRALLDVLPNVKLVHVRGHCGILGNCRADDLATAPLVSLRRTGKTRVKNTIENTIENTIDSWMVSDRCAWLTACLHKPQITDTSKRPRPVLPVLLTDMYRTRASPDPATPYSIPTEYAAIVALFL